MNLRVSHVSEFCQGGAVAMVRLHEGLRAAGVDSSVYTRQDVGAIPDTTQLVRAKPSLLQKARRRFAGDQAKQWRKRIQRASLDNPTFEIFSPPVAISPVQMDATLRDTDVLHLHWFGGFVDFQNFFANVDVPVVWTLHDQNPYLGGFHYQGDVDAATSMLDLEMECREIKRDSLRGLNLAVSANSNWNRDLAMTTGVLPADTIVERIYLPLPIEDYTPHSKSEAKQRLGIDAHQFVVGFASASLDNRRKGFADLIESLHRLPTAIRERTTLVSFGRDPDDSLRSSVDVPWRHLGQLDGGREQSVAYSAMDAFVIASLEEAFGQTPLEALACRTAVVGTRVGGIPETVIDGKTGLLASPGSPEELAHCIEQLFLDANLRQACGDAGRKLAETRHATDHVVSQHLDLYQRLLERHERHGQPDRTTAHQAA